MVLVRARRWNALVAVITSLLLLGVFWSPPASAGDGIATSVAFSRYQYNAPLGTAYAGPIEVTVTDSAGDPVVGAEVTFEVTPDSVSGAEPALDSATATTDSEGKATVGATAASVGGLSGLRATVGDAHGSALLVSRPPGYVPGEQLASVVAPDQDGVQRNIRDTVQSRTYTLIDVCAGWCFPCREFAQDVEKARQQLLDTYKIKLELTTLLQLGATELPVAPSTQSDAADWKSGNKLSGNVLHAEGSFTSSLFRAAEFFVLDDDSTAGAFPTHLLVGPDGKIVDRMVGLQGVPGDEDVTAIVNRVLDAAGRKPRGATPGQGQPPGQPPAQSTTVAGEVTVTLGGESVTERFSSDDAFYHETALGVVYYGEDDSDPASPKRQFGFQPAAGAFPSTGVLDLSLTRFRTDKKQPLASTSLPVALVAYFVDPGSPDVPVVVSVTTTAPATTAKTGTTNLSLDLADARSVLRAQIEAGNYTLTSGQLGVPTAEQVDQLVDGFVAVLAEATYVG